MIKLNPPNLEQASLGFLAKLQADVDKELTFAKKVMLTDSHWKNRRKNKAFDDVKDKLSKMCKGVRRCNYCEDSLADEIEHIYPRSLYPAKAFVWNNFLYACGPCNCSKNNKFEIFSKTTGEVKNITPPRVRLENYVPVAPEKGEPLLINPREEDPMDFLELDLLTQYPTFLFVERIDENGKERAFMRAAYTKKLLNKYPLANARRGAFGNYRARLREYVIEKESGAFQDKLNLIASGLKEEHHPSVWKEMIRQRKYIPELEHLFERAPEALDW